LFESKLFKNAVLLISLLLLLLIDSSFRYWFV